MRICIISILLCVVYMSTSVSALSQNSETYESYIYTNKGNPIKSPAAYVPYKLLDSKTFSVEGTIEPADIFIAKDKTIYVVDTKNSAIYLLNDKFELTGTISTIALSTEGDALSKPEGVFVNEKNDIYIADTGNKRLIIVDKNGNLIRKFNEPKIDVMKEKTAYYPTKVTVDKANRIYVVSKNINRGLIELDSIGNFKGFLGAPRIIPDMLDYFWKMISTKEQLKRMIKYTPTEYNNVFIDESGFIYATIGTIDPKELSNAILTHNSQTNKAPLKKLNPTGDDVLIRNGIYPPYGDLYFPYGEPSIFTDVFVNENGMYSVLDARNGRVFTYDSEGNLLYIFGGSGKQFGKFQTVSSLACIDGFVLVADKAQGSITVFEITEYGKCINEAVDLNYKGFYDKSEEKWKEALKDNSNLYMAYIGIGKAEYRKENYSLAMSYLKVVDEKIYFSKSYKFYRKDIIFRYLNVGVLCLIVIAVTAGLIHISNKRRQKKRINN